MKYIGTIVDTVDRGPRAESVISIEGLAKPQQIAVTWSIPRSPDALVELTPGTRVIFAAHEDTITQRTDTDESTGAISTVLAASGHFYDIIVDTRDAAEIYPTIETRDLELTGTVVAINKVGDNRSVVLSMPRHGQRQPIEARFPTPVAAAADLLAVGDETTVAAEERSLSWKIDLDDAGRRAVVPVVTATRIIGAPSATGGSSTR